MREVWSTVRCTHGAWVSGAAFRNLPHPAHMCPFAPSGAALGPLLAGLLSPSGWNNVFYMLMFADACALLVSLWSLTQRW